jgi:hypothetical protein
VEGTEETGLVGKLVDWLSFSLKFVLPCLLLALPLVPVYGVFSTWPDADRAMGQRQGQSTILVGFADRERYSLMDDKSEPTTSKIKLRQYINLPSFLSNPVLYQVQQINDNTPVVTSHDARPTLAGLLFAYFVGTLAVVWYWVWPHLGSRAPADHYKDW